VGYVTSCPGSDTCGPCLATRSTLRTLTPAATAAPGVSRCPGSLDDRADASWPVLEDRSGRRDVRLHGRLRRAGRAGRRRPGRLEGGPMIVVGCVTGTREGLGATTRHQANQRRAIGGDP